MFAGRRSATRAQSYKTNAPVRAARASMSNGIFLCKLFVIYNRRKNVCACARSVQLREQDSSSRMAGATGLLIVPHRMCASPELRPHRINKSSRERGCGERMPSASYRPARTITSTWPDLFLGHAKDTKGGSLTSPSFSWPPEQHRSVVWLLNGGPSEEISQGRMTNMQTIFVYIVRVQCFPGIQANQGSPPSFKQVDREPPPMSETI